MVPCNPTLIYTHPATCERSSPAGNHVIKPELFVRFQVLFSLKNTAVSPWRNERERERERDP